MTSPPRVAMVTGGARGIGAATVRRLAGDGYRVLAVDGCAGDGEGLPYPLATHDELQEVVDSTPPGSVLGHVADVRDRSALTKAVGIAMDQWGRLDAVVAGAAVIAGGQAQWDTPQDTIDLLWDVDVMGTWNTAAVAVPVMLSGAEPEGRFVAVTSAAGTHGLHLLAAYSMAKHAVVGLVKGLAADLVGTGVTACAVSPGSTRTPMLAATAALYNLSSIEEFKRNQLVRRILEPDEVAATIAFCCGRDASSVNGSVVYADGGFRP